MKAVFRLRAKPENKYH